MKKISFILLSFVFLHATTFGQAPKDTAYVKDIYLDLDNNIVNQKVMEFDSISVTDLMLYFENWGGQNFRNYSEVRTSKTENQIILKYITSSFGILDMYVQMVVEFKPNKMRVKLIDEGNVFQPGTYSSGVSTPAIQSYTYKVKDYFQDGIIIYKIAPGAWNIKEKQASGAKNYKSTCDATLLEVESFIRTSKEKKEVPVEKSDW
jgi:hypothetical protein